MSRLSGMWRDAWGAGIAAGQPWYRRSDIWLMAATAIVPFGWLLPLCRLALARAAGPRPRRF